jgi:predicted metal-dependent phosphoesterase TrpH
VLVDFHSHTTESDGTLSPADVVGLMRARGVEIFSITDHDALGAYPKIENLTNGARVITGIELNTTYKGNEVHVLGYGFPLDSPAIDEAVTSNKHERDMRAEKMIAQLQAAGYDLDIEAVRAEAAHEGTALGRPHVARALIRAGITKDIDSAFRDLLVPGKPGYVPQLYMLPHQAVELIAKAGGVPVLAHPSRLKNESIIDELVAAGLVGLEVFYGTHDANQVAHYRSVAAHFGLVMTAGSDFHDPKYNARGVGMDVERRDLTGFLDLVL